MSLSLPQRLKAAWNVLTHRADALSDLRNPTAWLTQWALGYRTTAGIDVSPDSALTLSAYFGAVRAISEDVGKIPLITYERMEPRGKRRAADHPLYTTLHDSPNHVMTAIDFRTAMTAYALTWGNAYAEIIRIGGQAVGLGRPVHPSRVTPKFNENDELVYDVSVSDVGVRSERMPEVSTLRFQQRDVLHIKGMGDGLQGYSVAQLAAESIGLSLAAQKTGAALFGNGLNVGGTLTHPSSLSEVALTHLRESLSKNYGGPENVGKWMILEEGMKAEKTTIPPEDAQFLETREFQVSEIARWFRIPPHKIAHLKDATFSNIEQQSLEYVSDALMPWLVRWEQEIKRKLFADEPEYFAEHLVTGLLRGDQQSRANYYRTLFYIGALSPNDIRDLENQNPIVDENGDPDPAGDMYYIQNNLATLATVAGREEPAQSAVAQEDDEEDDESPPFAFVPAQTNGHAKD